MRSVSLLALALLAASLTAAQGPSDGWAALDAGVNGGTSAAMIGPDGRLYLGGYFTAAGGQPSNTVAAWDGAAWASVGSTEPSGQVWALAFTPDGRLYAGGDFFVMNGMTLHSLAVWDGAAWGGVGGGVIFVEGAQTYGAVVNALAFGADGRLYVGGDFNRGRQGSVPMGAVGAWDGQAWSAVGGAGLGGAVPDGLPEVRALAFGPDGRLYAGGEFTTADGLPVANVAAWDGTAWDDLDGGLPSEFGIYTLAFGPDGRLYAGGDINTVVGGVDTDLAAWDGTSWRAVGPPVQGGFFALAFSADGKLYAGGNVTFTGGRYDVARLDGYRAGPGAGTWVPLGGGVTNPGFESTVQALAVGDEGEVYVGGSFDRVWEAPGGPSVAASNVAVWLGDYVVGAEEAPAAETLPLSVSPNPVPAGSAGRLSRAVRGDVVDVLGRVVGRVDGDRLPGGLPAGVYAVVADHRGRTDVVRFTVAR